MSTEKSQRNEIGPPIGVELAVDVEELEDRAKPFRARVRWTDPVTKKRRSLSRSKATREEAEDWCDEMRKLAAGGVDPDAATMPLASYGDLNLPLALKGLAAKTTDPYLAGWRKRVKPTLGHIPVRMVTYGAVDRAAISWIADGCTKSVIKNSLAMLVRVMEQAYRDGLVDRNPARITGWQREFQLAEDELDDPRSLALPDWETLERLASALVARAADNYAGWGNVVRFKACTAARIGEVSGIRVCDVDRESWIWNVRRQTTPGPGGLLNKATKGRRARKVPLIEEIRPLVASRLDAVGANPMARLFTGPRGGCVTTAILRDATHWDEVVTKLGYEHLRRHDLRHTGLTWLADSGVPVHVLRVIAGHGSLSTTQRYLHPDLSSIRDAGDLLSAHLSAPRSTSGPRLRVV
ncbi:tyrosine-type recombinase/integrase [Amycolatopsis sp. NPDC048633]|uniref:tyrosine-type recombinase/integrase n=1 Tax=Amycolatopsis sp. NPDC048633 TaxID=3157095 RepID=UPI0033F55736